MSAKQINTYFDLKALNKDGWNREKLEALKKLIYAYLYIGQEKK